LLRAVADHASKIALTRAISAAASARGSPLRGNGNGGNRVSRKRAPSSRSTRAGSTRSQSAVLEQRERGGHRGTAEERYGKFRHSFLVGQQVRCVPWRSAAIARRAATVPLGINSPASPRTARSCGPAWIVTGTVDLGDRDPVLDAASMAISNWQYGRRRRSSAGRPRPPDPHVRSRASRPPARFEDADVP